MSMRSRRIGVFAGLVILLGGMGGAYFLAQSKQPPTRKPETAAEKVVDTLIVQNSELSAPLALQGELVAFDKIDVFAEVSGTLLETSRPFKVGSFFPENAMLVRLDDTEARLNLLSQKSSLLNAITQMMPDLKVDYPDAYAHWSDYLEQFELEGAIRPLPEPVDKQEQFFVATRNIYSQFYSIKSAEERLSKYVLRAPFSGVVTAANIHPGALVRVGQKLGELMHTGLFELEATVPLSALRYVKTGYPVRVHSDATGQSWTGRVKRINDQVDPGTQTVKVFVGINGKNLREGMYLRGEVEGSRISGAFRLPKTLLVDQTQVYAVIDGKLQLLEVEVVRSSERGAIVRGIPDGTALLAQPLPGSYPGLPVRIRSQSDDESVTRSGPDDQPASLTAAEGPAQN